MSKTALITGIGGMDGSHLAELLLNKGYEVYGLERRLSEKNRNNVANIVNDIEFICGDLSDQPSLIRALKESNPDEVYNLAAQSFVGDSWSIPTQTSDITALGVLRMLEAIRFHGKDVKFYQASSSEMFGKMQAPVANEQTAFYPRSPYGVSKQYGHWMTKNYRESYGMFNCCGILFNHESERRGLEFVTRKITNGIALIKCGKADKIYLGNLESKRDWGYAPDYVEAMWLMLQQDKPDDYVVATGKSFSIRDFLSEAFNVVGITDWEKHIGIDEKFMRPAEVDCLKGDSSKAKEVLGWSPKVSFKEMVKRMVENDVNLVSR